MEKRFGIVVLFAILFSIAPVVVGGDGLRLFRVSTITQEACRFYKMPFWNVFKMWMVEDPKLLEDAEYAPKACEYAWGVPRLLGSTARGLGYKGKYSDLKKYEVSIPLGVKHFHYLYRKHKGDMKRVCQEWSGGPKFRGLWYWKKYSSLKGGD